MEGDRFAYETLTDAAKRGLVRGVTFDAKTRLWRARLSIDGTRVDLGRNHPSVRNAVDAIRTAARNYRLDVTDEKLFVARKTNGDPKPAPLGFRGISWHKRSGKWRVQRCEDGVQRYLGLFDTLPEAVTALHEG